MSQSRRKAPVTSAKAAAKPKGGRAVRARRTRAVPTLRELSEARKAQPTRPYEEFIAELERRGEI